MNALYGTPFVHRNAVSREECFYCLNAWLKSGTGDEKYPILVLSYHESQGTISLKDDDPIDWEDEDTWAESDSIATLAEIPKVLVKQFNKCKNRIIHFSSCSSLDVGHEEIEGFLEATGVMRAMPGRGTGRGLAP